MCTTVPVGPTSIPGPYPPSGDRLPAGTRCTVLVMADQLTVPGMPSPLVPSPEGLWRVDETTGAVTVSAQPRTDIFIDPSGVGVDGDENAAPILNAATLLADLPPEGDFQFSARVSVAFAATFDAGVLLIWRDERCWGTALRLFAGGVPGTARERGRRRGAAGRGPGAGVARLERDHDPGLA